MIVKSRVVESGGDLKAAHSSKFDNMILNPSDDQELLWSKIADEDR